MILARPSPPLPRNTSFLLHFLTVNKCEELLPTFKIVHGFSLSPAQCRPFLQGYSRIFSSRRKAFEILHEKPPLHKVASQKRSLSSSSRPCKKIRAEEAERTSNQQKMHSDGNKLKSIKAELDLIKLESEESLGRSNFSTISSPTIKKRKEKPLTCAEKDKALQRANTFKVKNPYFKTVMQPSYIRKNYLNIPVNFVKKYLKQKEGDVLLRVSDGRTWCVKFNREEGNQHKLRLSSGWPSFAKSNNLKVGDVCVF